MIWVAPGATFEATLQGATTGLTGTIGVRILDGAGATTVARSTSGIVEYPSGSGFYTATLTAPTTAGQYSVLWDTGSVGPTSTSAEDLTVTYSQATTAGPSGSDLVTLAQAREFLQKQSVDTSQDSILQNVISRASAAVMEFTEREFAPATASATRVFDVEIIGQTLVSFAPYDCRSVSAVTVDADVSAVTLSSAEYRLYPNPAADGVYTGIRVMPFGISVGSVPWRHRQVSVTGAWGFSSVPVDVQHWTLVTVAEWMRKDVAAFSTVYNLAEDKVDRPEMLPAAARAGLAGWQRMTIF